LLENAVKYSPVDGTITSTAELNGTSVMTSVVDRGGGIDDSEQTLIFEKFYRRKYHRYAVEGTGMGLAIANAIIKAHRGSLCVARGGGQGCSFSFTLPIDPQLSGASGQAANSHKGCQK
jgi:signal transduction histidine kinase